MDLPINPELAGELNVSEMYSGIWSSLPPEMLEKINLLFDLSAAILVIAAAYFVILILVKLISFIFGSSESKRLKRISGQLDEVIELMRGRERKKVERENSGKELKKKKSSKL